MSLHDIKKFEETYKGSAEEIDALKTVYVEKEGDIDAILDEVKEQTRYKGDPPSQFSPKFSAMTLIRGMTVINRNPTTNHIMLIIIDDGLARHVFNGDTPPPPTP